MIGSGTPSIQSNMPRPIGSLLLRLLSRDLQTIAMFISSSKNSKKPLVLLRFSTGNSSRGGREVRTWAFGSEQKPYRPDFRLFIPWHDDQHVAGQWPLNVTRLFPGSRHPAGRRESVTYAFRMNNCAIGVHERIRTSDPRIHTTSAFAAVPPLGGRVRGLDCPFTMGVNAFRCCPSSLYTFNGFLRSLARDWHAGSPAKRSPTLSRSIASFPGATPNFT